MATLYDVFAAWYSDNDCPVKDTMDYLVTGEYGAGKIETDLSDDDLINDLEKFADAVLNYSKFTKKHAKRAIKAFRTYQQKVKEHPGTLGGLEWDIYIEGKLDDGKNLGEFVWEDE